ncbi:MULTISPECIES: hypothetical protein, partial [unclassified Ensifer]|uniref:hypothetical protein n=1 Tax=unclassified Ensifer TaxID=2633371 RepID=UPI001939BD47
MLDLDRPHFGKLLFCRYYRRDIKRRMRQEHRRWTTAEKVAIVPKTDERDEANAAPSRFTATSSRIVGGSPMYPITTPSNFDKKSTAWASTVRSAIYSDLKASFDLIDSQRFRCDGICDSRLRGGVSWASSIRWIFATV